MNAAVAQVSQRERQRIRHVMALWGLVQIQHGTHHVGHLRLVGTAATDERLFDLHRTVLEYRDIEFFCGEQAHPYRLAYLERGFPLLMKILSFYRKRIRSMFFQKILGRHVETVKPLGLSRLAMRAHECAAQVQHRTPLFTHSAKT